MKCELDAVSGAIDPVWDTSPAPCDSLYSCFIHVNWFEKIYFTHSNPHLRK